MQTAIWFFRPSRAAVRCAERSWLLFGTELPLTEPRSARPRDGDRTVLQCGLCQPNPKEAGTAHHPHPIASPCGRSGDARRPAAAASRGWEDHYGYDPDTSRIWCRWLLCGLSGPWLSRATSGRGAAIPALVVGTLCQPKHKNIRAWSPCISQIAVPGGGPAMRGAFGAVSRGWEDHYGYDPDNSQTWCRWLLCGQSSHLSFELVFSFSAV